MTIAWSHFTPYASLVGGVLIGLAAALFLLGNGRIAGIAGVVAGGLRTLISGKPSAAEMPHVLFLIGLLVSPWVWRRFATYPTATFDIGFVGLMVAGLLVGVGVRMANGCTSGHGVCGLSRFSLRSLCNVLAFMGAGFVTVFVLRHAIL